MKVLVLVKATVDSEAGVMPSEELLRAMGQFNEDLVKAGVLLAAEGLRPSVHGKRVRYSGTKRTVIDGLRQPEYCGGVAEVAKGLWMRRQDMQTTKLVDYALRLGIGAVIRRLGYLLELYAIAPESELARLRKALTATYVSLDPVLPKEGSHLRRWRLQLNITPQELETIRTS